MHYTYLFRFLLTLPDLPPHRLRSCPPHHSPQADPPQWASVQVRETLMSHHKHSDSPLMKLEQYLLSYSRAAAPRHPAGGRICEMRKHNFYPLVKRKERIWSLAGGWMETLDNLTFWKPFLKVLVELFF